MRKSQKRSCNQWICPLCLQPCLLACLLLGSLQKAGLPKGVYRLGSLPQAYRQRLSNPCHPCLNRHQHRPRRQHHHYHLVDCQQDGRWNNGNTMETSGCEGTDDFVKVEREDALACPWAASSCSGLLGPVKVHRHNASWNTLDYRKSPQVTCSVRP